MDVEPEIGSKRLRPDAFDASLSHELSLARTHDDKFRSVLLSKVGDDEHRAGLQSALQTLDSARAVAQTSLPDCIERQLSGLDYFAKFFEFWKREMNQALDRSMRTIANDLCRTTKKNGDPALTFRLLTKLRDCAKGSESTLIACLRLCFRVQPKDAKIYLVRSPKISTDRAVGNEIGFLYYKGRLASITRETGDAEHWFSEAYSRIPFKLKKHKRMVFERLLPLRLVQGRKPSRELLERLDATDLFEDYYSKLLVAVQQGDMLLLKTELHRNTHYYSAMGCLEILSFSLEVAVLRNIIRFCVREVTRADPSRVGLDLLCRFLPTATDSNMEALDAVVTVLSQLIARGAVSGYISFQDNSLVLGANNTFPTLRRAHVKEYHHSLVM